MLSGATRTLCLAVSMQNYCRKQRCQVCCEIWFATVLYFSLIFENKVSTHAVNRFTGASAALKFQITRKSGASRHRSHCQVALYLFHFSIFSFSNSFSMLAEERTAGFGRNNRAHTRHTNDPTKSPKLHKSAQQCQKLSSKKHQNNPTSLRSTLRRSRPRLPLKCFLLLLHLKRARQQRRRFARFCVARFTSAQAGDKPTSASSNGVDTHKPVADQKLPIWQTVCFAAVPCAHFDCRFLVEIATSCLDQRFLGCMSSLFVCFSPCSLGFLLRLTS